MESPKTKNTKDSRARRQLGRLKGETLEALEQTEDAVRKALEQVRAEGADARLPAAAYRELARAHAGLTRVLARQQVVRGFDLALKSNSHET